MLLLTTVASEASSTARAGFIDRPTTIDPTSHQSAGEPPQWVSIGTRLAIAPKCAPALDQEIDFFDRLVQSPFTLLGESPQTADGTENWTSLMNGVTWQSDVPQALNTPDNGWIMARIPGRIGARIDFHNDRHQRREMAFTNSGFLEGPPLDRVDAPSSLVSLGIGFVVLSVLSSRGTKDLAIPAIPKAKDAPAFVRS